MRWIILLLALCLGAGPAGACDKDGGSSCDVAAGNYLIAVPPGMDRPGAMVWLHGMGGSAEGVMKNGAWIRVLADRGMALIAPDGMVLAERHNGRKNWTVADGEAYPRDDVAFIDQVIDDAVSRYGIDRDRILLAGFSRGGSMVWDIACQRPNTARAYAPVAGAFWEPMTDTCAGPVQLFHTHGWVDRVVPLEGRSFRGGAKIQGDVFQSLYVLREVLGCANRQPASGPIQGDRWWRHWSDCRTGRIDLMLHPSGHSIPRGWLTTALDWFQARLDSDCQALAQADGAGATPC
ncbi:MAG: PHB depolymerase family esterase [Pseudomonadota bacterium]